MSFSSTLAHLLIGTCPRCGRSDLRGICRECRQKGPLTRRTTGGIPCWAIGPFQGELERGIKLMKFSDEPIWARHLGGALASLAPELAEPITLIPVPLHPVRCAERGYNQAALLSRCIGAERGWPVRFDLLARCAATAQQARLSLSERKRNIENAFSAHGGRLEASSSQIVLVDDVITSGHTIDACAEVLRSAGFNVVGALFCASVAPDYRESQKIV